MDKAEGSTKRGRAVCLDPVELAFRGFVWKLSPVYADGVLDKSQRLESIVGEKVTIRGSDAAAWLTWLNANNGIYVESG